MQIDQEVDIDLNSDPVVETPEETPVVETTEPKVETKPVETPEARVSRLQRQLKQAKKQAGIEDEAPKTSKSSEIDYGELAYLAAKGIDADEEVELVQKVMADTGKSLKEVVGSKYFQAELKELKDAKAVEDATPSGTKRSGQSARDQVDYWLAKGELPPPDQRELRIQVVNARMKAETSKNMFTDNPVVK